MDKYIIGALSGMTATIIVQPIDLIKVNKQINPEKSFFSIITNIYKLNNYSFLNFYRGIDIALIRQSIYGTIRLGMFQDLKDNYKFNPLTASIISSSCATIANNPIDYWLINKQTNKNFSIKHDIKQNGFYKILFTGITYNFGRAISINLGFGIRPFIEEKINNKTFAIISSSFLSTIFALPFDILRTLSQKNIPFNYNYFNIKQIIISYPIFASRILPHTIISMYCIDFYSSLIKKLNY